MRRARKRFAGAKYHVTNRGNGRDPIFYKDRDRERFLDQLQDGLSKDGVVLYAYSLLPNHYHLLIETLRGNIDRFMKRLGTAYAMYFRYKHYRPGHCFQGRYKSPLVAGDDYIMRLGRYIHLNPVCISGMKNWPAKKKWEYLKEYKWSSLRGYLREEDREEFVNYRWLDLFDEKNVKKARRAYGMFMRRQIGKEDSALTESFGAGGYAIGSEEFRQEVTEWVKGTAGRELNFRDVVMPVERAVAGGVIEQEVAREYRLEKSALRQSAHRMGSARWTYVELLCTIGQMTQRQVAALLGVTEHAVGKCRNRFRDRLAADEMLATRLADLRERCVARV